MILGPYHSQCPQGLLLYYCALIALYRAISLVILGPYHSQCPQGLLLYYCALIALYRAISLVILGPYHSQCPQGLLLCTDSPIQSHFTGDTGALPLTVSSRLTTVLLCALIALYRAISLVILGPYHSQCPQGLLLCTDSPIQSHFTGDTGALPLTVSSRLTTVLLCALIALYRAISLVILGPYHSQCPQGLLLYTTVCTDSPIQSHFTGDTGALPLTVSSRLTTVLLCALIALYRAISLVILGPYHSQCPQGLLLYYCEH